MKPINYNDTEEYQFMEVFGIKGAFTSQRIDNETLPEGFYKYSMRDGEEDYFGQICNNVGVDHAGDFITKEPIDLSPEGAKNLTSDDWRFSRENFEFEPYFGKKLSIDYQIDQAEMRRNDQLNNKSHVKSVDKVSSLGRREEQER